MITNDRQFRITKSQRKKIKKSIADFDLDTVARHTNTILAKAEYEALKSEFDILTQQINEYELLKSGAIRVLKAESLNELPTLLIKARISRGLSQGQLAKILPIKEQQIQRYESENYSSASLRRLTEIAQALEINISEVAEIKTQKKNTKVTSKVDIIWDAFPVKEMYLRNWFEGFSGSLTAALNDAEDLAKSFVLSALPKPSPALMRRHLRMGSSPDQYALLAWQCRIINLAKSAPLNSMYNKKIITKEWLIGLAQKSSTGDGPRQAKTYLEKAGIHLIIEPHLDQTYLDGAAILLPNGTPIVGMTLRYDRLDNFWFVLLHELIHIVKHLRKGHLEDIFDDLDAEPDELEREADQLAGSCLIPDDLWETSIARYVRSKDSILELAEELKINPAIIAGRIRKEAENYIILTDLVGQKEVRKHFPNATFS